MVALASATIRMRPLIDKREFVKAGEDAGGAGGVGAGKSYGDGFKRGSDGKLRDAHGKFVKDSEAAGRTAGGKAGASFGGGFGKGTSKLGDIIKKNIPLAAGVFVPLGLAAGVGAIAKIGIAYQDNMNIFKVVSKATAAQMDTVAAKARQLGADVTLPGVSAAGAASAMTELAKAGFTVQQSMDAARATLQLARVANISEADAAEIAANAVNAFGLQAKDTTFVVDELAAAANSSSIEISDASLAFKQAAAVFSGVQGPAVGSKEAITELNTAIAILGNNGIKGSDAGTSLKQMLLQLTGPTNQAKGLMKELALNAAGANISLSQQNEILHGSNSVRTKALAEVIKNNKGIKDTGDIAYTASGQMRGLKDIIALTAKGTAGMTQEEKNYVVTQIFGADASRSVIALLKGGLPVYEKQRQAVLQQGAAAQFAAAKNAGLGGAIDNVKSQFENASISIFNASKGPLTAALTGFANFLPGFFAAAGRVFSFIADNIGVFRDWALAIGAVTLALKINSLMLAVTAAGGIVEFIKGGQLIVGITKSWAAAQALLNITLIANPIGAVIIGITLLVAGIILAYRHSATFRAIVQGAWAGIKIAVQATVDFITQKVWPALQATWNAIAGAALWLWHNVFQPVWSGIMTAVNFAVTSVRVYIAAAVATFNVVAGVVRWLYSTIFAPIFAAISKVVQIWWLATRIVFVLFMDVLRASVMPTIQLLRVVFGAVFSFLAASVRAWWGVALAVFGAFRTYVLGPVIAALGSTRNFFVTTFNAVSAVISAWWNAHVRPVFAAFQAGWRNLGAALSAIYTGVIKPVFSAFVGFIRGTVVAGFNSGVNAIRAAWAKVQEAARKPVAFVVNRVINPFIGGLNKAAAIVGIKDRVAPIAGFAAGGLPGTDGGKISGSSGLSDNRLAQAMIPGVGAVKLAGGEFVVKRSMTAKALPLLRWVNDGMKGGLSKVGSYIGRPLTQYPGDGSEGWAFKGGGLVGWIKDVWDAVSHPLATIKRPFEEALGRIPGGGMIKDFLVGAGKKVLNGAVGWLTRSAGGGGDVGKARAFVQAEAGKPYIWADAGPDGYDCSGIVSAAYNVLKGKSPYSHTFSTESLPGSWFRQGQRTGALIAGWSHPGQSPASASVGHMAGQIGGMPFESSGSRGVHIGGSARGVGQFANIGAARVGGGMVPVKIFDAGGAWPTGTLGANLSGRTEYVDANRGGNRRGGDVHLHLHNEGVIGSQKEMDTWLSKSITRLKRDKKLP